MAFLPIAAFIVLGPSPFSSSYASRFCVSSVFLFYVIIILSNQLTPTSFWYYSPFIPTLGPTGESLSLKLFLYDYNKYEYFLIDSNHINNSWIEKLKNWKLHVVIIIKSFFLYLLKLKKYWCKMIHTIQFEEETDYQKTNLCCL